MPASGQPWLHHLVTALRAPTAVLSEHSGQIRPAGAQGALHADVRILSAAVLEVGGAEPVPLSGGLLDASRALFIGIARAQGDPGPDPTVRVERERLVAAGQLRERIRLVSTADAPVESELTLRVAADLASIGEIKAGRGRRPVPVSRSTAAEPSGGSPAALSWASGPVQVRLAAPGATASLLADGQARLSWPVWLGRRGELEVEWELTVADPAAVVIPAPGESAAAATSHEADPLEGRSRSAGGSVAIMKSRAVAAAVSLPAAGPWTDVEVEGDDPRLARLLRQALSDAAVLALATPQAPNDVFLGGGAPWYMTLFGRDSIWAARLMLPFGWPLAAGTLRALAGLQGRRLDPATGEAPGKILHELRTAGRQAPGGLPARYYGTIDATSLWVCLLHDAWRWGMPADQVRALLPSLAAALAFMRDYGDADGDGLLEYIDESGHGLANQGWKDSGDAIRYRDGSIAAPPVALCEVQGYAYEAAQAGAVLLEEFGEPGAGQWRDWAARLASTFRGSFWVDDGGGPYPALALDSAKRPVDSLTSNIGHLLGTGLLTDREERLVVARLTGPDMDSGFGLRTMSSASGGYSPLSYHCGSVWSHDTAIVIRGLARGGHPAAAALADELLDAAAAFDWRLPELFAGDARDRVPWPSPYPASCRPQAWAAASAGALVQALLGLDADVPAGRVTVSPPPRRPARGARLRVDGLIAGEQTFSAGISASGEGYLRGLRPW